MRKIKIWKQRNLKSKGTLCSIALLRTTFDRCYARYNRREFVHPDPVEFLYDYSRVEDREIAGLIASSLAYGRVQQILVSVRSVLAGMGPHPERFLRHATKPQLQRQWGAFRHRFTSGEELISLLWGMRNVMNSYGSLQACFLAGIHQACAKGLQNQDLVLDALVLFSREIACSSSYLVPTPEQGSACKRLNLFLRWMVRQDEVDPGGWVGVDPAWLCVPVDVHMARIGTRLGFTQRKSAALPMMREITEGFRAVNPDDPVKYDFALTRMAMRGELTQIERLLGAHP